MKLFQDYYDFTQNTTFLRNHAYPLAKLNAEFYLSYMTREPSFPQACDGGCYNVMHSCAMVREANHHYKRYASSCCSKAIIRSPVCVYL